MYFSICPEIEPLTSALTGVRCLLACSWEIEFFENTVSLKIFDLGYAGEIAAKLLILMPGKGIEPSLTLR